MSSFEIGKFSPDAVDALDNAVGVELSGALQALTAATHDVYIHPVEFAGEILEARPAITANTRPSSMMFSLMSNGLEAQQYGDCQFASYSLVKGLGSEAVTAINESATLKVYGGTAPVFFTSNGANHIALAISLESGPNIMIDPSFGAITLLDGSGYTPSKLSSNLGDDLPVYSEQFLPFAVSEFDTGDSKALKVPEDYAGQALGLSSSSEIVASVFPYSLDHTPHIGVAWNNVEGDHYMATMRDGDIDYYRVINGPFAALGLPTSDLGITETSQKELEVILELTQSAEIFDVALPPGHAGALSLQGGYGAIQPRSSVLA